MTDQLEDATVTAGASPRVAEPHEHFVELPTRLWKILLAGGTVIWLFSALITELTGDTMLVPTTASSR